MESAIRNIPASFEQIASKLAGAKMPDVRSVVSLFSGCGGMDLGFIGGFEFGGKIYDRMPHKIVWANEIDCYACSTYRRNMRHEIVEGDIQEIIKAGSLPKNSDILLGGFPCQDFSHAGKRGGLQTERGSLYKSMVTVAEQIKPKVFIAENVKGILSIPCAIDRIKNDFSNAGFHHVTEYLVQAADYGVPQNRERVFIIGWRDKKHYAAFSMPNKQKRMTVREAIDDLADIKWGKFDGHTWALAKRRSGLQGNEVTCADGIAYTIRAEHHMNIQFHHNNQRRLSVREAARLQTFPDDFVLGGVSKHQGYRMIGNAVPPVLAWHIAKSVADALSA